MVRSGWGDRVWGEMLAPGDFMFTVFDALPPGSPTSTSPSSPSCATSPS